MKDIYLIEWVDSRVPTSRWEFLDDNDFPEISTCFSVGFLFKDDEKQKILVSNISDIEDETPQGVGVIIIPTQSIIRIEKIGEILKGIK